MIEESSSGWLRLSRESIYKGFGKSRQAYHQHKRRRHQQSEQQQQVVAAVLCQRHLHSRRGGRKLLAVLRSSAEAVYSGGRDRFFAILRQHDLLIRPKRRFCKTTDSKHGFGRHKNLLKQQTISSCAQAVVSDITYIQTDKSFVYLALVTDYYSRKILGYDVSESLSVEGALRAMRMAIRQIKPTQGSIHHSDRGVQYSCQAYQDLLRRHKMLTSMTEENHCYENAVAERLNGILKMEYNLGLCFRNIKQVRRAVRQAIYLYNEDRPHSSLAGNTPSQVFAA